MAGEPARRGSPRPGKWRSPPPIRWSFCKLLLGALTAAFVSGCSGGDDKSVDEAFGELFGVVDSYELGGLERRELAAIEERVSTCMADAGFVYAPVSFDGEEAWAREREEMPDDTYVAEHGFGIVEAARRGLGEAPNAGYVAELSPAEREAFMARLVGPAEEELATPYHAAATPAQHASFVLTHANVGGGGCFGEAIAGTSFIARYIALTREIVATNRTQQHLEASSRYQALVADWRACMNDQGFSFDQPTDAEDVVHRRVWPLLASAGGDAAAMEDELADVARFETEVAVADHDCGGSEIDEVYQSIFRETLVDVARERGELSGDR